MLRQEINLLLNKFFVSIWIITKTNILRCTVSKISKIDLFPLQVVLLKLTAHVGYI